MKFSLPTILAAASLVTSTTAFAPSIQRSVVTTQLSSSRSRSPHPTRPVAASRARTPAPLMATATDDDEVTRLKAQAAQLRAEAAELEAAKQARVAQAAERAFDKFDQNDDGELTLEELKAGLEKTFKMDLPEQRVEQLMEAFDTSGDGVLQKDEMVQIEQFRNKLEALTRDEQEQARSDAQRATEERESAELLQQALELINDDEPTTQDKVLSAVPYLFPLLDGLQFAAPWVVAHPDNPVAQAASVAYGLYRAIPLGGFLAFIALSTLSSNPKINRLVRFNMQQAIFLDIALFFPAALVSLGNWASTATGGAGLPPAVGETISTSLLLIMLANVSYATVSSLAGQEPDKIPFISQAVKRRLPSFQIMNMEGRVLSKEEREETRKQLDKLKQPQDKDDSEQQ